MNDEKTNRLILIANAIIIILAVVIVGLIILDKNSNSSSSAQHRALEAEQQLANSYLNNELYEAAIEKYRTIIDNYQLEPEKMANILYIIGNIYFDNLKKIDDALATYIELRELYPESDLINDVNKKIIACLDYAGRAAQAQQELHASTALSQDKEHPKGGKIVARLGERNITERELNAEYNKLPRQQMEQFAGATGRYQFLQQYLINELLYRKAKRRNYDQDPELLDNLANLKKQLMAQMFIRDELGDENQQIDEALMQAYYQKNKAQFQGKPFAEVKDQVYSKLVNEKLNILQNKLLSDMLRDEEVQMYPESLGVTAQELKAMSQPENSQANTSNETP